MEMDENQRLEVLKNIGSFTSFRPPDFPQVECDSFYASYRLNWVMVAGSYATYMFLKMYVFPRWNTRGEFAGFMDYSYSDIDVWQPRGSLLSLFDQSADEIHPIDTGYNSSNGICSEMKYNVMNDEYNVMVTRETICGQRDYLQEMRRWVCSVVGCFDMNAVHMAMLYDWERKQIKFVCLPFFIHWLEDPAHVVKLGCVSQPVPTLIRMSYRSALDGYPVMRLSLPHFPELRPFHPRSFSNEVCSACEISHCLVSRYQNLTVQQCMQKWVSSFHQNVHNRISKRNAERWMFCKTKGYQFVHPLLQGLLLKSVDVHESDDTVSTIFYLYRDFYFFILFNLCCVNPLF